MYAFTCTVPETCIAKSEHIIAIRRSKVEVVEGEDGGVPQVDEFGAIECERLVFKPFLRMLASQAPSAPHTAPPTLSTTLDVTFESDREEWLVKFIPPLAGEYALDIQVGTREDVGGDTSPASQIEPTNMKPIYISPIKLTVIESDDDMLVRLHYLVFEKYTLASDLGLIAAQVSTLEQEQLKLGVAGMEKEVIQLRLEKLKLETDIRSLLEIGLTEERDRLRKLVHNAKVKQKAINADMAKAEAKKAKSLRALSKLETERETLKLDVVGQQQVLADIQKENREMYSKVKDIKAQLGDDQEDDDHFSDISALEEEDDDDISLSVSDAEDELPTGTIMTVKSPETTISQENGKPEASTQPKPLLADDDDAVESEPEKTKKKGCCTIL